MSFSFTLVIFKLKLRYRTRYCIENRILLEQSMNKDSRIYPDLSYKILNKHQKSLTFTHTNKGTSYLYTTFLYIKKKNPEIISNQGEASLFLINSH